MQIQTQTKNTTMKNVKNVDESRVYIKFRSDKIKNYDNEWIAFTIRVLRAQKH